MRRRKIICLAFALPGFALFSAQPAELPGGLTAWPKTSTEIISIANPGFEESLNGWSPAKPEAFSLSFEPGLAHGGKACVRFDAAQTTSFVPSIRQGLDLAPGIYTLRFWLKTRELGSKGKPSEGVRVQFDFQREDGQRAWPATEVFRGSRDWQSRELRVLIPRDVKSKSIFLTIARYGGASGGEAFFDDFSLERAVPPPIEAFLLYPNYRGFLPENGPSRIRIWVRINTPRPAAPAELLVRDEPSGRAVARMEIPAGQTEQILEIDASAWPLGNYLLQAKSGEAAYPAYRVCKITAGRQKQIAIWFDPHGVMHQNGKPTFVLGFYNAGGFDSIERLDQLAQAHPNLTIDYMSWAFSLADQRRYLAQLHDRGLSFLHTVNMVYPGNEYNVLRHPIGKELLPDVREVDDTQENLDRYLRRLAEAMRSTPGHAGWYTMDERPFCQAEQCFHQYQVLREADPDDPTFCASDKPDELAFWRDAVDVFSMDPYPLFNMKQDRPLSMVGDWTRAAAQATHGSRPLWMVIQFFQGWSTDRWPTEEELRAMSLMALTEGARGLWYWSFGVRALKWVKDKDEQAEYWRRALKVCQELKLLEPALLAPDAPGLVRSVSAPQIRWRARRAGGKTYVLAYRPATRHSEQSQPAVEVVFTLRDGQKIARKFAPDSADWFVVSTK